MHQGLEEVQILTPSFDSDIAIHVMEYYEASIRPRSVALAGLYWWLMSGLETPSNIAENPKLKGLYITSTEKVIALCDLVNHNLKPLTPELPESMYSLAKFLRAELAKNDPSITNRQSLNVDHDFQLEQPQASDSKGYQNDS